MNSIIILPEERCSSNLARIEGERARYIHEFHDLKPGIKIRAAELDGKCGLAIVRETSPDRTVLELQLDCDSIPPEPLTAIVAVPRPQILKKLLQTAAMMGVAELCLVKSSSVVKSYMQSKSLQPGRMRAEIIKGLEQSCASVPPRIEIYWSFDSVMQDNLSGRLSSGNESPPLMLAADTGAGAVSMNEIDITAAAQPVILAIGPESGWDPEEVARLHAAGFKSVGLGPRILRVEVAFAALLGQISLLRQHSEPNKP